MKNIIKTVMIPTTFFLLTACGGGAGGGTKGGLGATETITMKIGVAMPIEAGYRILSDDPDAFVDIIVIDNNKTATLLNGKATIEKPI